MTDRPVISSILPLGPMTLAALIAFGTAGTAREWPSAPYRGQFSEQPPCSCRSTSGKSVEVGREACLRTAEGAKRALCIMVINNTSWQVGQEGCEPEQDLTN